MAPGALAMRSSDRKAEASLTIVMAHTPPDICTAKVSDKLFTLPKDEAITALREARRTCISTSIGSAADIPYRCTAAVIYVAQQAGFERIGFVALPPPPKPKASKPR